MNDSILFKQIYNIVSQTVEEDKAIESDIFEIKNTAYNSTGLDYYVDSASKKAFQNLKDYLKKFSKASTMAQVIDEICDEKGLEIKDIAKRAESRQARQTIYRLADHSKPSSAEKFTLICMSFYLEATLEQSEKLLKSAGYVFAENNPSEMIAKYCIENKKTIDFYDVMVDLFYCNKEL